MEPSVFTVREAAEVLGVEAEALERWVRSGLVTASQRRGRQRLLAFGDLVAAKAAKELLERGVSARAVKRSLAALEAKLPEASHSLRRPLSRLRVVSDGDELVVVDEERAYEPRSGQVVMDFVLGALSTRAAEVLALSPGARGTETPEAPTSAWDAFTRACDDEAAGRLERAEAGYHAALERDPHLAAAHTNLGNLAARAGHRGEARQRYEQALALDPDQPEARYNLANLLDALGEPERALAEWTRVCAVEPTFGDAHYNLGVGLARAGQPLGACAALERYLTLDGAGPWAAAAQALLDSLRARALEASASRTA